MEKQKITQLLRQYLLGNAAEKDISAVDNWYQSFDSGDLVSLSEEEAAATKQEIWSKVQSAISDERKIWRLPRYWKVAAMILLMVGAGAISLLLKNYRAGQSNAIAFTTISTGIGQKKKIIIQDGSQLILNAGTTVRVQNDFSGDRKIELVDGEVFFDVKKDEKRPFIIQSQGVTTTVLGTSFSISAYKELNKLSIGVLSGKVSVAGQLVPFSLLEKEQELIYDKDAGSYKRIALDPSLTAWQNGRLVLNDLSFREMAVLIKKNFGIEMQTRDEAIRNKRFTADLPVSMSPVKAAQVLAAIYSLRIEKKGNQIFLSK